nr:hypothetical protein [Tanacetum cinerariifolium]
MEYPLSHKLDENEHPHTATCQCCKKGIKVQNDLKDFHEEIREIHYSLNNNFKLLCSMVEPLAKAATHAARSIKPYTWLRCSRSIQIGIHKCEIDQDDKIALDADTQGRKNDNKMFGVDDLSGKEVFLDTTTGEHEEQIIEDVTTAKPVNTAGEVVTTVADKVSAAPTTYVTEDEIKMAQALAALKITTAVPNPRAKGIVFHEQKQSHIPIVSSSKDKSKAKMIEPEVHTKKKDQIRMDEEYARQLEAKEQEAARLSRAQQDEEANISWDNIQAMMKADSLLAERLQAREREEFFEVKKARLLVELIEKRKKHFAALRAQEKRNKPPTKAQMRSQMCTYLRNMGGYKHSYLKKRSYDKIKKLFDKEMKKKQKVDENVEPVIDDTGELKKCLEIVPDDGDEVLIKATPIPSRSPTIIDYKIHKEGKNYFKIIRADNSEDEYQVQGRIVGIKGLQGVTAIQTQNDGFAFVHELKQEMHDDLKYVESLEKEINELESDKAEFSNRCSL